MKAIQFAVKRRSSRNGDKDTVNTVSESSLDDDSNEDSFLIRKGSLRSQSQYHSFASPRHTLVSPPRQSPPKKRSLKKPSTDESLALVQSRDSLFKENWPLWDDRDDVQLLGDSQSERVLQQEQVSYDLHPYEPTEAVYNLPLELLRVQIEHEALVNDETAHHETIDLVGNVDSPSKRVTDMLVDQLPSIPQFDPKASNPIDRIFIQPCIGTPEWSRFLQDRQTKACKRKKIVRANLLPVEEEEDSSWCSRDLPPIDVVAFDSSQLDDSSYDDDIDELEI
jgi:hypothetical protein